jgi:hypothetical protein
MEGKPQSGDIDMTDYDAFPVMFRFNLSVMADQIIRKINELAF